jgi:hypothetical protein
MVGRVTEPTFDPNGLLVQVQGAPVFGEMVTVISGQNLAAGAVLGKITASGKFNLSLTAAADGSQTPVAVLAEACDASGGDKQAFAYYTGEFNEAKLVFGTAHTAAALRQSLAQKGLFIIRAMAS